MKKKMMKFVYSKSLLIILVIMLIILTIAASTYAWFTWSSTNNTSVTMSIGSIGDVVFTSGNDISANNLGPVFSYTDGEKTTFTIKNRSTTDSFEYVVKINITTIADSLKSNSLKYKLLKGSTQVAEGNFSSATSGSSMSIYTGTMVASTAATEFTLYIYIDGNIENNTSMMNNYINGTITVTDINNVNLSSYINYLYNNATKTSVVNNSVTYQYDTTNKLMRDTGNNIRYYGANPNNYVYFNCSDYSNQSSSTCEKWRIIGYNNTSGMVKIVRNESIGNFKWSLDDSSDWGTSSLVEMLNDSNDNSIEHAGLYWNSGSSITCSISSVGSCNFTNNGIEDSTITKNMIENALWYTMGITFNEIYMDNAYDEERTGTTWTGKIALPYASDYGYAADFNNCKTNLAGYNNSTCTNNNWLFKGIDMFTLSPIQGNDGLLFFVTSSGYMFDIEASSYYYGVYPTLYLKNSVNKIGGTGTSTDPYKLSS